MVTTAAESTSPGKGRPTGPQAPQASGRSQSGVRTQAGAGEDGSTTIRLPLVTVTLTRPDAQDSRQPPRATRTPSGGGGPAPAGPAGTGATSVGGVSPARAAFYAGAVALGALEVVEWPVTLLVVAGTYLADQVRGSTAAGARPAAESSASTGPVPPASAGHPAGS